MCLKHIWVVCTMGCWGSEPSLRSQRLPPGGTALGWECCYDHPQEERQAYGQKGHESFSHPEPPSPPFPHRCGFPNKLEAGGGE